MPSLEPQPQSQSQPPPPSSTEAENLIQKLVNLLHGYKLPPLPKRDNRKQPPDCEPQTDTTTKIKQQVLVSAIQNAGRAAGYQFDDQHKAGVRAASTPSTADWSMRFKLDENITAGSTPFPGIRFKWSGDILGLLEDLLRSKSREALCSQRGAKVKEYIEEDSGLKELLADFERYITRDFKYNFYGFEPDQYDAFLKALIDLCKPLYHDLFDRRDREWARIRTFRTLMRVYPPAEAKSAKPLTDEEYEALEHPDNAFALTQSDMAVIAGRPQGGFERNAPQWEIKREPILEQLLYVIGLLRSVTDGIVLRLNDSGDVVWDWGGIELDANTKTEFEAVLSQTFCELDTNKIGLLLLSSWSKYCVLRRISPVDIEISSVVTRSDIGANEQQPASDIVGTYEQGWAGEGWSPLKLVFSVLLVGRTSSDLLGCYDQSTPPVASANSGQSRKRGRSGAKKSDQRSQSNPSASAGGTAGNTGASSSGASSFVAAMGSGTSEASGTASYSSGDMPLTPSFPVETVEGASLRVTFDSRFDLSRHKTLHRWAPQNLIRPFWHPCRPSTHAEPVVKRARHALSSESLRSIPSPVSTKQPITTMAKLQSSFTPEHTVMLTSFASHGRLYDVCRGRLYPADCEVVVKLVNFQSFPAIVPPDDLYTYSRQDAMSAVVNEIELFSGRLKSLQGYVVPIFYGAWRLSLGNIEGDFNRSDVVALVLSDEGDVQAAPSYVVQALYQQLHDAGVLHGDVQPRHILTNRNNAVRLIDFEAARVNPAKEVIDKEMAVVERILHRR